jgi:hypothetical protein
MPSVEEKWQANQVKVAFVKQFPGLLSNWAPCVGKTIKQVIPLSKGPGAVLLIEDGTFAIAAPPSQDPVAIQDGLATAKEALGVHYDQAYAELDRLTARDRELTRQSRLEKILGAIQNNLPAIPELKQEIRTLLDRLPD